MASFDFGSISAYKFALSANVKTNTNANSAAIDTAGYEGVAVVTAVAASALNAETSLTLSAEFLQGDDTNISNASALPSGYIVSNPTIAASNTAYWASVVPSKRYLFVKYVPTTNADANIVSIGALGFAHEAPTQ